MSVDWGCRVSCDADGCNKKVIAWSKDGTPSLPHTGIHDGGNLNGWTLFHRGRRFTPVDYGTSHVAYCPLHSGPAIQWFNDFKKWQNERDRVKLKEPTLWERIVAFRNPEHGERLRRWRIQEADRDWVNDNPPPKPPWKR